MTETLQGTEPFDFDADTFDSRDVIARIAYLESTTNPLDRTDEEQDEIDDLYDLQDQASGSVTDWQYGETFISEDYFVDYAEELARETGSIGPGADWPLSHINWEAAAEELMEDYTEFELRGTTYYARP